MNNQLNLLSAFGLGAGLMFLFDPSSRNRRRALLRDKMVHGLHQARDAVEVAGRDVSNRARGAAHRARSAFTPQHVDDRVLTARVRSRLGRLVTHPHAINVEAEEGVIWLKGAVLSPEVSRLLRGVAMVSGVRGIKQGLEIHKSSHGVPALQGEGRKGARQAAPGKLHLRWTPTSRLFLSLSLLLFSALAFRRRALGRMDYDEEMRRVLAA